MAGDKIECEVEGIGKLSRNHRPFAEITLKPKISLPHAVIREQRRA